MKKSTFLIIIAEAFLVIGILSCDDAGVTANKIDLYLRLSSTTGEDAYITTFYDTVSFPNDPDFAGIAWCLDTGCTMQYTGRTLFKFRFDTIPSNATVTSAKLYLAYNPNPVHSPGPGHRNTGGSNACLIQRVTQSWSSGTVTWSTQPAVDPSAQVTLPASTSNSENYAVDITSLIQAQVSNPSTNYGFMLRLQTESPLRSLNFASSDNPDSTVRPLLIMSYTH